MSVVLCLPAHLCVSTAASRGQAPHGNASLGSLRVVPVRGPTMGLSLAGPSGVGLGLRALRWLACVDPVTDASRFPYRPSFDGGLGRCTGAVSCGRRQLPLRVGGRHARVPCVCACARPSWPGRAGRPPGRVLVRLTFSLGCFVFLLCSAPSGLGLPLSWSFVCPPPPLCSFVFFSSPLPFPAHLLCLLLSLVSGPGCPGPWRCVLVVCCLVVAPPPPPPPPFCVSRFFLPLLRALCFFFLSSCPRPRCLSVSPVSGPGVLGLGAGLLLGCWLLLGGWRPPPLPFCVARFPSPPLGAVFFFPLPSCAPVVFGFLWFLAPGALGLALCFVCFPGLPLLGSRLAFVCSLVFAAPPVLCSFFFLFCFCAPVVFGFLWFPAPGALGLGAARCLLGWPPASRLSVRSRLAVGCSPVVSSPPPPCRVSRFSSLPLGAVCRVLCCAVCPGVRCCAVLRRLCRPVLCCCVLCCFAALVWCRRLLCRALWRCPSPWGPVLCGAVFSRVPPRCVCFVVAWWCVPLFAALLCAVCVLGCCAVRSLSSPLCAVLCFAVLVRLCCAVRVVRAVAGAWCCGVLLCVVVFPLVCCGAVLGLVARGCLLVPCCGALLSVFLCWWCWFVSFPCVCGAVLRCASCCSVPVWSALLLVPRAVACPCALWCLPGRSAVWWCCSGCRGVLLCCVLSCGDLRPVPCPAVPCCPAVLCWLAVLCGCLRCWCLFFLLSSFPLLKAPAVFRAFENFLETKNLNVSV